MFEVCKGPRPPRHILGNGRLSDFDPVLEQFTVDPWRTQSQLARLSLPDPAPPANADRVSGKDNLTSCEAEEVRADSEEVDRKHVH